MGKQYTLSLCRGKGSLHHNNREFIAENVDKNRVNLDVTLERKTVEGIYAETFGKALTDYNAKQKRKERKIDNYLDHIKHSKNHEKVFDEIVVTLGNKAHHPTDAEAKKIMTEFYQRFKNANKNCIAFNAVIHLDESTPHMHIDFLTVKRQVKKGLAIQISNKGALKEMGYGTSKDEYIRWLGDNKKILADIAQENDIEIIAGKAQGEKQIDINEFRKLMRSNEQELAQIPDVKVRENTSIFGSHSGEVIVKKEDIVAINRKAKLAVVMVKDINQRENNFKSEIKELTEERRYLSSENLRLQEENTDLSSKFHKLSQDVEKLLDIAKKNLLSLKFELVQAFGNLDKGIIKEYDLKQNELQKPNYGSLQIKRQGKSIETMRNTVHSMLDAGQKAQKQVRSNGRLSVVSVQTKSSINLAQNIVKLAQSAGASVPNYGHVNGPDLSSMNEIDKDEIIKALEKAGKLSEAVAIEDEYEHFS